MTPDRRFPTLALGILATAIFANITVEMLPMGLVLPMSRELGVSEGQIGLLVSVFAFTVVASSSLLIRATRRVPRHLLVIIVLVTFSLTCFATAAAQTYEWVMVARLSGGFAHGVFWTVVGGYGAYLVPKEQLGKAVGITSAGGSLAFVMGLPLATWLGQTIGWRGTFTILGAVCLVCAILVWRFLPRVNHLAHLATTETGSVAIPVPGARGSAGRLAVVVLVCALSMTGQYALYTYIAPFLVSDVGLQESWLSPALGAYGVMGALAVVLITMWIGKRPLYYLVIGLVIAIVSVSVLTWTDQVPIAFGAMLIWGLAMGAVPPLLNTRLLQLAPERLIQPSMAWYTAGFNFGIGFGALLGAFVMDNAGVSALPWILLAGMGAGLALLLGDWAIARGQRLRAPSPTPS